MNNKQHATRPAECRQPALLSLMLFCLIGLCTDSARAQGTLTNGWMHTGTIAPIGDSDSWTFPANNGDRIVIRVGEITQTGSFTPRIRLMNPSAVQQAINSGALDAEIVVTATNSGTFTVIVDDAIGTAATGTYRLTLAQSPGSVFVAPGDQGGAMTNGYQHSGTIDVGDLDVWTFSANAGDAIVLRMGSVGYNPWIRLFGPDGVLVGQAFDGSAGVRDADLRIQATNSGPFTVVVGSLFVNGTGSYILSLAHAPGAVAVSSGDQGGPMTNAFQHTGMIDVGDLDVWTFSANAGDAIVLRMGSVGYNPWIRLFGPNGAFVGQAFDSSTGVRDTDLRIQATNSGTFTVVASSLSQNGAGAYILTLAHVPESITVSPGDQGGPMTNAVQHTGTIDVGDLDVWSFSANAGDAIVLRMGSVGYNPWIRLFGPNGAFVGQAFDSSTGVRDTDLRIQATNSGTFTVVASSLSQNGAGAYILTLAHVPEAITVSPGDQGGLMTNAFQHAGFLEIGDLDVWSFSANSGDAISLRMGTTNLYNPWIRLFSPSGVLVAQGYDSSTGIRDADIHIQATNSGTFTVVVGSLFQNGTGAYRLTLAHVPEAITVSAGDQGGQMTNGFQHTGMIDVGDLDVWRFSANTGDGIALRMGGTGYNPWLRLFSPSGVLIGEGFDSSTGIRDAEVRAQATNSGTFTVVVGAGFLNGNGAYILTLAHAPPGGASPDPIVVSPGDQGGSMTNGVQHGGNIDIGDMDVWSFSASTGDGIALRMGATGYNPWIRIYGPNGTLVGQAFDTSNGIRDADLRIQATNSGTFTVVAAALFLNGNGPYILTLGRSPGPIVVSSGDEGGSMTNGFQYTGTVNVGDLDLWSFAACKGNFLTLTCEELTGGTGFSPRMRLFSPNGVLLVTALNATTATINYHTTNSGSFTLIVDGGSLNNTGTYRLTGSGFADDGLRLCVPSIAGTNLTVTGIGGLSGANGVLLSSTNVAAPIGLWAPLITNQFDTFGVFTYSSLFNRGELQRYFILRTP